MSSTSGEELMKMFRLRDAKMVAILRKSEMGAISEVAWEGEISERTIYNWCRHFDGLQPAE